MDFSELRKFRHKKNTDTGLLLQAKNIGGISATFRTSIVRVAVKFHKLSEKRDEISQFLTKYRCELSFWLEENLFWLNGNASALNKFSFRFYLAKVCWL